MIKVRPTVTLELETSEQKITVDLQEAKEIIKSLSKFVNGTSSDIKTSDEQSGRGKRKRAKVATPRKGGKRGRPSQKTKSAQKNIPSMSENKRQEIIDHINKQLSARPKTLSALLKGVSYVPNYLPAIRQMVEARGNTNREIFGKRVYYSRKASSQQKPKQSKTSAIGA